MCCSMWPFCTAFLLPMGVPLLLVDTKLLSSR